MAARDLLRVLVIDAGDDAAQHGGAVDAGDGGGVGKDLFVAVDLVGLDIDEEVAGRAVRQFGGERAAQVAVDLADGGEHRKAKAERQDDGGRLSPPRADAGERQPQGRPPPRGAAREARDEADQGGGEHQDQQRPRDAASGPEREPGGAREPDGQSQQQRDQTGGEDKVGPARQGSPTGEGVAEQGGGADLFRPGQGPEGEDRRRQQAVDRGLDQGCGVDAEVGGDGQPRLDHRGEGEGDAAAENEANGDAEQRQRADLDRVGRKDRAARGTQRLERGDGAGLVAKVGAHGGADAHATDGKARQADEDQEGAHAFDKAGSAASPFAAVTPAHAGVAELGVGAILQRLQISARG